jgi:aconitate decarboxylase
VSETAHAIGVAATQVVGLREMFGSHTKSFHPGRAAQCGLLAAVMAQGGYTSSEQALEAKRGWANVVGATKTDIQKSLQHWVGTQDNVVGLVSGGAGRWEILRNSFKPFPCGIVIHPVIDACEQLHGEMVKQGLDVHKIKAVTAKVHHLVLELTGKKTPKDGLEGKFSVFHSGACGLLLGKATPAEYEDSVVNDAQVIAIRDRIHAEIDPSLGADQARVTVVMEDGQQMEKYVEHAVGSVEVPMDDAKLESKFVDQCSAVLGDDVNAASKACWEIERLPDISEITKFL